MRNFNKIDINALKAFYYAALSRNFSKAAVLCNSTQSGVSQHVSRLEKELGVDLFRREKRGVEITEAGIELKNFTEEYLDNVDNLINNLNTRLNELTGLVRYAMPASCLKTPHFPLLLKAREEFKKIDLRISILHNEKIISKVIENELDFGFVTKKLHHTNLEYHEFAKEEYVLVGTKELVKEFDKKTMFTIPFIDYPGMGALLEYFQSSNFPSKRSFNVDAINIVGNINHLDGAITMCLHGMGVSIFPSHCVEQYLKSGKLVKFSGKKDPSESIYIVHKKNPNFPARISKVLDTFWDMK